MDERPIAAIVLAGGQGRRLGGADKPGLKVGGLSLVGSVVTAAIRSGAAHVVVVGPERPELIDEIGRGGRAPRVNVEFTCEEPAGGGPVPALRAGLGLVTEPWTLLLAADLPFLSDAVLIEVRSAAVSDPGGNVGAVLVDDAGQPQWLVSCWRTAELRAALESYRGDSLRDLFAPMPYANLTVLAPPGEPPFWLDCDTPEDLATAGQWARGIRVSRLHAFPTPRLPDFTSPICEDLP